MIMSGEDLARMLAGGGRSDDREERKHTPDDVLAITLKEISARYAAGNPFKVGELITPRKGYGIKGEGRPHVVVEIADKPLVSTSGGSGSPEFGARLDIRVICEQCHVHAYWMESWQFERYAGPVAEVYPGA